ncbi:MAG: hypothetical protein JW709_11140 [Sedimentisphaerales bacterium]|nr:hypothetical protein [Sedimentisphaerales bacterium]
MNVVIYHLLREMSLVRPSGLCIERISRTLCVNPGQEHGRLCAVWWDSDNPDMVVHNLGIAM